jgi:hypothetical protein|tara:strand:+ start:64 stop:468 length:405 start_codon:yes stop_codon:yes gene_type:complete
MAKIVYGKRDTATVVSIEKAPQSIQTLWNASNVLGVNIVRVRANKERYETTAGDTFNGYHAGRVSIYQQKPNPRNPLHFVRRTPLGKDNKGMQILEVATNIDVQDTLKVVSDYEYYTANSFFARLKMTFTRLFA